MCLAFLPGLNEVALGITVPKYWCALMARTVGQGPAEKLVQGAVMLAPAAALARGLVDEVVPRQQLLPTAEAAAARLAALPEVGRAVRGDCACGCTWLCCAAALGVVLLLARCWMIEF